MLACVHVHVYACTCMHVRVSISLMGGLCSVIIIIVNSQLCVYPLWATPCSNPVSDRGPFPKCACRQAHNNCSLIAVYSDVGCHSDTGC